MVTIFSETTGKISINEEHITFFESNIVDSEKCISIELLNNRTVTFFGVNKYNSDAHLLPWSCKSFVKSWVEK